MASEGVVATLEEGWRALAQVDAPKAVIGGLAMTAWKHARYTRDADWRGTMRHGRSSRHRFFRPADAGRGAWPTRGRRT